MLRTLKLPAMAASFADLALKAAKAGLTHEAFLYELAQAELAQREQRRVARLLHQSGLPPEKTFRTLELARFPPALRQQLERLRSGSFVEEAVNVLAVGHPAKSSWLSRIPDDEGRPVGHVLVQATLPRPIGSCDGRMRDRSACRWERQVGNHRNGGRAIILDTGVHFGWPMTRCNGRGPFPPSQDLSVRVAAALARFSVIDYSRAFHSCERVPACQLPDASERRPPTTGRYSSSASTGRSRLSTSSFAPSSCSGSHRRNGRSRPVPRSGPSAARRTSSTVPALPACSGQMRQRSACPRASATRSCC